MNKVAIITGSGSGIGRASAINFAAQGARVVCADNDLAAGFETANFIETAGGEAISVFTDVSSKQSNLDMVAQTIEVFGRIDILYANAGIHLPGSVTTTSLKDWHRVMSVNLNGVWLSNQAVIPAMLDQGCGSIINQSSISALSGFPDSAAYAASKGAVLSLTRQTAIEYAKQGIRVNAICPGAVNTPLLVKRYRERPSHEAETIFLPEEVSTIAGDKYPLKRIGSSDDVAQMAVFLGSDESQWITGAVFTIDGGYTAA